jgi:hypothetical protein
MTKALRFLAALLLALPVFAQAQRTYSPPELEQMLAPIALYPDALLSQVLMAATYPIEVEEAARWSRSNPGLQGEDAVRAVQNEDWDPSVKSLLAFPQLLARMAENPAWTQSLGEAFLAQEPHVMDAVQQLRRRAQAAGNLQSSSQMNVQQQGASIVVQPASPQYVYVPYYDPMVAYGRWWWPAYQPVVWAPWPRPVRVYLSLGFFFGNFDWNYRHVRVVHPSAFYYRQAFAPNRTIVIAPQRWQHEPPRRAAFVEGRRVQAQQVQVQSVARVQALPATTVQAQPAPAARARAQPEHIRMPAASAPQQPRAERQEHRPEHREQRQERREERGRKAG